MDWCALLTSGSLLRKTCRLPLEVDTASSWPSSLHSMWSRLRSSSSVITSDVSFRSCSSWILMVFSPQEAALPIVVEMAMPLSASRWFFTWNSSCPISFMCVEMTTKKPLENPMRM